MWVNRQEWKDMKKKVAVLEKSYQEQQEILDLIVENQGKELEQMKLAFAEAKESIQNGIVDAILRVDQESKQT